METLKSNSFLLIAGSAIVALIVIKMLFPAQEAIVLNGTSKVVLEIQYCGG
jgi:hypothetical protein